MKRLEKTVFISYRRKDTFHALSVFQHLTHHGYDVFFDFIGIGSGDFERIILENIKARAHFLVLLTPSALERCSEPGDWLRREIETAIETKRNIIPLIFEGFDFSTPSIGNQLTGHLATLKSYNGLPVPGAYFNEAMDRLRGQYLDVPLEMVLHPASRPAQDAAKTQQASAITAPMVKQDELIAEEDRSRIEEERNRAHEEAEQRRLEEKTQRKTSAERLGEEERQRSEEEARKKAEEKERTRIEEQKNRERQEEENGLEAEAQRKLEAERLREQERRRVKESKEKAEEEERRHREEQRDLARQEEENRLKVEAQRKLEAERLREQQREHAAKENKRKAEERRQKEKQRDEAQRKLEVERLREQEERERAKKRKEKAEEEQRRHREEQRDRARQEQERRFVLVPQPPAPSQRTSVVETPEPVAEKTPDSIAASEFDIGACIGTLLFASVVVFCVASYYPYFPFTSFEYFFDVFTIMGETLKSVGTFEFSMLLTIDFYKSLHDYFTRTIGQLFAIIASCFVVLLVGGPFMVVTHASATKIGVPIGIAVCVVALFLSLSSWNVLNIWVAVWVVAGCVFGALGKLQPDDVK